jgi:putative ABC transport system ATP-binding protein
VSTGAPLFDLEGVSASRGGRTVLEGVNLVIETGATALQGPSPGTVADNVGYGPALCGRRADVASALEQAGLRADFAARLVTDLSVGEQQRVMLARALALEPDVLLLDEPTSALDEDTREEVERTLIELAAGSGSSIVVVTHDTGQAARLAGRTVHVRDGRVDGRVDAR